MRLLPGQITTDGFGSYPPVIDALWRGNVDYGQQIKDYDSPTATEARRYSPATCKVVETKIIMGDPDPTKISTSYVERQNLTMRMGMRRFTRLTNEFSKKVENLAHAVSLHYMHYNFCRVHQSLTITRPDGKRVKRTPAMAAGVADHAWSVYELVGLLTRLDQTDPLPGPRPTRTLWTSRGRSALSPRSRHRSRHVRAGQTLR